MAIYTGPCWIFNFDNNHSFQVNLSGTFQNTQYQINCRYYHITCEIEFDIFQRFCRSQLLTRNMPFNPVSCYLRMGYVHYAYELLFSEYF